MKRALLILAVLLALPTAAQAYNPTDLARWENVADQTFGGACAGRLHADVVTSLPADGSDGQLVLLGQAHINDATTCTFQIVAGLKPYEACVVTVHEAGHLAGLDHTPGGVMDAHPVDVLAYGAYKPCARFAPPVLTKSAALNWVEARWFMASSDCRRESPSRWRCWGRTVHDTRILAIVRMDGDYRVRGKRRIGGRSK